MTAAPPPFAIVYSAIGAQFVEQAAISAWSAKRHMPEARTVLVTDQMAECPWFDEIRTVRGASPGESPAKLAKLNKVDAVLAVPEDHVLYVDCDTYFAASVRDVWLHLGDAMIAAAFDTWQLADIYRLHNHGLPEHAPPPSCPFFNCGVLFLRKSVALENLLLNWQRRFRADPRVVLEQLVFRELIYASPVTMHVLPAVYNARICEPVHLSGTVRIAHRHCPTDLWRTSLPFLTDFVNSTTTNRIFSPFDNTMVAMDVSFNRVDYALSLHGALVEQERFLRPALSIGPHRDDAPGGRAGRHADALANPRCDA